AVLTDIIGFDRIGALARKSQGWPYFTRSHQKDILSQQTPSNDHIEIQLSTSVPSSLVSIVVSFVFASSARYGGSTITHSTLCGGRNRQVIRTMACFSKPLLTEQTGQLLRASPARLSISP